MNMPMVAPIFARPEYHERRTYWKAVEEATVSNRGVVSNEGSAEYVWPLGT